MAAVLTAVFWVSAAVIAYACVVYPLGLGLAGRFRRPWRRGNDFPRTVSIVIAARNEEDKIAARVCEILEHLAGAGIDGEVLVVSDGSTDATAQRVRVLGDCAVRVIELPEHCGKAMAINRGCAEARGEILVLADSRQRWEAGALTRLLENFCDPQVGAVSGELILEQADGALVGVGLYWRLEKWIRRQEAGLHSCVGVTGAMSAVRRRLFCPIPTGTILDDVYWPLRVALAGYRVVHDHRARSFDRLPPRPRDEFLRKVRTLSGNFQLVGRLPGVLRPWRNPVFIPFLSHKLLRLAVPWAMLGLLFTSSVLAGNVYRAALAVQCAGYGCALLGLCSRAASRLPLVSAAAAFLLLNGACWLALFVWLSGAASRSWRPVRYEAST